ncbi:MAG TPA: tripartite tricarboxylate transporter substrate binding protein [Bradyrhizobium sp.]|jgi:tripartite-type tricarboxylate transporter receptor subunit TctC|uniref:Bug family tripartite tricarboxylate transporter substrate binding protein n=1 Tax=Bradyrhizobium sp. TaxID=376 RepID=UPI002B9C66C6|nr:tripartite tricarboxylate transporter substrate binding protein [Bradyrhizobium sp.]HTB04461.1 tripartite tricarboxylate transporter substrate binding protein [Bradyrhizobium sp.]
MKFPRRKFLHLAASAVALPAISRLAQAETYPSRPVRIVVGYPPGGVTDIVARLIGPWLSERLGQQFFVENRPGASSNIATAAVVRSPPDGYTFILLSSANSANVTLYDNLNFDLIHDIVPVASIGRDGFVMVVDPSFPTKTVPEFIAYAKTKPGKLNMATSGAGSGSDLYGQLFKVMAAIDLVAVHYRGVANGLQDLLAGRVEVMFLPVATAIGHIQAGRLRPLGVTTTSRRDVLPDVPAIGDFVPGYEATNWEGLGAPVNTSPEIIAIVNSQVNAALADTAFKARLADLGGEPFPSSPADFGKFIAEDTEKWGKVIRAAGIKAD